MVSLKWSILENLENKVRGHAKFQVYKVNTTLVIPLMSKLICDLLILLSISSRLSLSCKDRIVSALNLNNDLQTCCILKKLWNSFFGFLQYGNSCDSILEELLSIFSLFYGIYCTNIHKMDESFEPL